MIVIALCAVPIVFGFALPVLELSRLAILVGDPMWGPRFYAFASNSLMLAGLAAVPILDDLQAA